MTKYKLDNPNTVVIDENRTVIYTISKKHRGKNKNKSSWSIAMHEEVDLFADALKKGYEEDNIAWNLLFDGKAVCVVGYSTDDYELKLAKFLDSDKKDQWHGYPADYLKNIQDIPPYDFLKRWMEAKYITVAVMAKIRKGQRCNL